MNNVFVLRQDVTPAEIHDAIDERIEKLKGIVGCLLTCIDTPQEIAHAALWAMDGYLEELERLHK